jgi:metal-responsive CopG/Arc/MetJ family transcriptional regulator
MSRQVNVYIPEHLIRRLEEYLERRYRRAGLVPPSPGDVVRGILQRFLEEQQRLLEEQEREAAR